MRGSKATDVQVASHPSALGVSMIENPLAVLIARSREKSAAGAGRLSLIWSGHRTEMSHVSLVSRSTANPREPTKD